MLTLSETWFVTQTSVESVEIGGQSHELVVTRHPLAATGIIGRVKGPSVAGLSYRQEAFGFGVDPYTLKDLQEAQAAQEGQRRPRLPGVLPFQFDFQ